MGVSGAAGWAGRGRIPGEVEGLSGAEGREVKENAPRVFFPGTCLP